MLCRRQCRPYLFGHFMFSCQSADGGNEDVDEDNETRQIECWSFWRRSFSPLQSKAVFPSCFLVFMLLKLSIESSTPLGVLVAYVLV